MRGKLIMLATFVMLLTAFAFAPKVYAYSCNSVNTGVSPWSLNFTGNNGFSDLQYRSGPIGTTCEETSTAYNSEGAMPGNYVTQDYTIGFKGPGICDVGVIAATSPSEALGYAKDECPECKVKDLTNANIQDLGPKAALPGETVFPTTSERDAYCGVIK